MGVNEAAKTWCSENYARRNKDFLNIGWGKPKNRLGKKKLLLTLKIWKHIDLLSQEGRCDLQTKIIHLTKNLYKLVMIAWNRLQIATYTFQ